jgi:hypothetical protein
VVCNNYIDKTINGNKEKELCEFESCKSCIRRYILSSGSIAQCMHCKQSFSRDYLIDNLGHDWVNKYYNDYHAKLLYQTEITHLDQHMNEAINYKKIPSLRQSNRNIDDMIHELKQQKLDNEKKIWCYSNFRPFDKKEKEKKFMMRCPVNNCNGFLNSQWNCELCDNKICKNCMEIDNNTDHKCDIKKVQTMELLNKDTKPCPGCGEMIMKINGCDQMWCPKCKNAWSWNKCVIVHENIHNPHYYEYQRHMNNGVAPRVIGDIPCGGVPSIHDWLYHVCRHNNMHSNNMQYFLTTKLHQLYLFYIDIRDLATDNIRLEIEKFDHLKKKARVRYILKELSDDQFKKKICEHTLQSEKLINTNQIYELFETILRETLIKIFNYERDNTIGIDDNEKNMITKTLQDLEQSIKYVNKELYHISYIYKKSVKIIEKCDDFDVTYKLVNKKIKSKGEIQNILKNF